MDNFLYIREVSEYIKYNSKSISSISTPTLCNTLRGYFKVMIIYLFSHFHINF